MKNKKGQIMDTKILAIVLLIIGVVALGSYYTFNPNEIEVEKIVEFCPEDNMAILDIRIYSFAENLYDSSEMFYTYNVFNYGNVEARNVKVNCKSWDINMNLQFSLEDNFGSVSSKSYKAGEVVGINKASDTTEYISDCYVSSCDNCKILYKEIPELIEYFDSN